MLFKKGSKAPTGANGKPSTGAVPQGGYGSYGAPSRAQKMSAKKGKPKGGRKNAKAYKPAGGYGTHGKPTEKARQSGFSSKSKVNIGSVGADGMATPKSPVPTNMSKLFNMPKGKFTY